MVPGAVRRLTLWVAEERDIQGGGTAGYELYDDLVMLHMKIAHDTNCWRSLLLCMYTSTVFGLVLNMASETSERS